ncbi:Outer surface protein of unknown function, cellobiose operon [Pediococcus damnosus]|uniref:MupG family TIM beta-alpha barrel fold protein n=1 Tax=Pediococcus damnosus TaxID=51663 RepID=UPI00078CF96E|nr:MupG family TIM beta-alpha barrel fold protein [Pediococcus damnosus]AMV60430.1 Outer surface protein of unknown function, cellobiose operon [Pediococcus damnosus]
MLGFSIYLDTEIDGRTENYIKNMSQNGFTGVFTSVHIPEDDDSKYVERLKSLGEICANQNLELTVDIDYQGLKNLGCSVNDAGKLTQFGISALRLDDGFTNSEIAILSHQLAIALNASTISESDVHELTVQNANFDHMEAWHNYYPRPETGLDAAWFAKKNAWLKEQHFSVMAFVSGDTNFRGPVYRGLPTLEVQRNMNPLVATNELDKNFEVDKVFVGDPQISNQLMKQFESFYQHNEIRLRIKTAYPQIFDQVWHNRPEVARDVVRLVESRQQNQKTSVNIRPEQMNVRKIGTITIDNLNYGRYEGEIQICKRALEASKKVNVIGQVNQTDIVLLPLIGENTAIKFIPYEEDSQ